MVCHGILTFRNQPVFETSSDMEGMRYPMVSMRQDALSVATLEEVRSGVYSSYEEIHQIQSRVDKAYKVYVHMCEKLRVSEDYEGRIRVWNCEKFMSYFFHHHGELTEYDTWSGSDIRDLLHVFRDVLTYLQTMLDELDVAADTMELRFDNLMARRY